MDSRKKNISIIIGVLAAIVVGIFIYSGQIALAPSNPTPVDSSVLITAHINESVSALDVGLKPLEVTEDSRCPLDVQCIWAGTVKVRVALESGLGASEMVFELGKTNTTEAEAIILVGVKPDPHAGVKIETSDYVFTFRVEKRTP